MSKTEKTDEDYTAAITNIFESYINLFDAKKEAQKLREENMKLHMEIQILSQLQEKNKKLISEQSKKAEEGDLS